MSNMSKSDSIGVMYTSYQEWTLLNEKIFCF